MTREPSSSLASTMGFASLTVRFTLDTIFRITFSSFSLVPKLTSFLKRRPDCSMNTWWGPLIMISVTVGSSTRGWSTSSPRMELKTPSITSRFSVKVIYCFLDSSATSSAIVSRISSSSRFLVISSRPETIWRISFIYCCISSILVCLLSPEPAPGPSGPPAPSPEPGSCRTGGWRTDLPGPLTPSHRHSTESGLLLLLESCPYHSCQTPG